MIYTHLINNARPDVLCIVLFIKLVVVQVAWLLLTRRIGINETNLNFSLSYIHFPSMI